jgi:hypothetical protein
VNEQQVQIKNWRVPSELEAASFDVKPEEVHKPEPPAQSQSQAKTQQSNLLEKLLPLVGKINDGALDITGVLDLLEKSGKGFGALGKLLPILAPLLKKFKKKPKKEDIIDVKTVNLDPD